ncbi:MAG TPA: rod shape-determining protein MreD [Sphingomonadales bacterium]|nr:rod shape-determining protein MreD [Sphingomonadales bacterium]
MAAAMKAAEVRGLTGAAPAAFTLLVILLSRVPFQDSALGPLLPLFGLMFAYHFRLYFPNAAPLWLLFAFGLIEDFLSGGALGLTSLLLLVVAGLFERKRVLFASASFGTEIVTFAVFSLAFAGAYWLVAGFVEGRLLPPVPFLVQAAATAVAFPAYVWTFTRLFRQYGS